MAIGKISGPMLQSNLERQGVDLSVDDNAVYIDVTNNWLGVNCVPTTTLTVNGNANIASLVIAGNAISSTTGKLSLGSLSNVVITGGSANYVVTTDGNGNLAWAQISDLDFTFGNISIVDTTIAVTALNSNLVLAANGSGTISANSTRITNVTTPISNTDVANKDYVDTALINFDDDRIVSSNSSIVASSSNVVVTVDSVLQAYYTPTNARIASVNITGNVISSASANLYLAGATASSRVIFNSTSAATLPAGTLAERPSVAQRGDIRFNTDSGTVEFYTGIEWTAVTTNVDSQTITGNGVDDTFTLDYQTNSYGILVSINGTLQQPNTSYTVVGDQLTMVEIPLTTDVIEVRFISVTTNPTSNSTFIDSANVTIPSGLSTIDGFSGTVYRSAKYTAQVSCGSEFQMDDMLLIHDGSAANLVITTARTGSNLGIFTSTVSGSLVELHFTALNNDTVIRLQKAQFLI